MSVNLEMLGRDKAINKVALPIDSQAMDGLGKHHTLHSAVADIIDNSISADASTVLVRFLQKSGRIVGVQIVDNGKGMTTAGLRDGMTVGKRRLYRPGELGHFGMGLKASSFSQAHVLSVWTRASQGEPAGMRMSKVSMMNGAICDVLSRSSALEKLEGTNYGFDLATGTIVQWTDVHGMSAADDLVDQTRWFENTLVELKQQLAVIFHRLLEVGAVDIYVDVFDVARSEQGLRSKLTPIDPFEYRQSALSDFPMRLTGDVAGEPFALDCHILPPGSSSSSARLLGRPREQFQGIFVYRRDRLQHMGGWSSLLASEKALQLARVEFDVGSGIDDHVKINPEKLGVKLSPALATAIDRAASSSGTTFRQYLDAARNAYKRSNKRPRAHRRLAPMGEGFSDASRLLLASNEKLVRPDTAPIDIRWKAFTAGLYELELEERVIYLNENYREFITGATRDETQDGQLIKTLLFLLLEEEFTKSHLQRNRQQDHFRLSLALELALQDDNGHRSLEGKRHE